MNVFSGKYFHVSLQEEALVKLKEANPSGRFWLKIDGTDVKTALMESMSGKWNGDVDLGDGSLKAMRKEYDERVKCVNELTDQEQDKKVLSDRLVMCTSKLANDIDFLSKEFTSAAESYKNKYDAPNTPVSTLKDSNWNVVEYQMLLQEAQQIKLTFENCISKLNDDSCGNLIENTTVKVKAYLRNLFKKKRVAASHVEVIMVSDEKRNYKPYALPVKFVPCQTLRDQQVRDLIKEVKQCMSDKGLKVVGELLQCSPDIKIFCK